MKTLNKTAKIGAILAGYITLSVANASTATNFMYLIESNGVTTADITSPYGLMEGTDIGNVTSNVASTAMAATPYGVANKFVYIAYSDGSIGIFKPSESGALVDQKKSLLNQKKTSFMAAGLSGKHLYATNEDDNTISVFDIDQTTGELTLGSTVATTGNKPTSIALNENRAIVTNHDSNTITMFEIESNGALTSMSTTTVGEHPILAKVIGSKFVHVLNEGNNGASTISQFKFPEGGTTLVKLSPSQVAVSSNAQFMVPRNDEKYMFVSSKRSDHKDSIQMWSITEGGTLSLLQTMIGGDVSGESSSLKTSLSMDPRDQTVYLGNPDLNRVAAYVINESTQKLNSAPASTFSATGVQSSDANITSEDVIDLSVVADDDYKDITKSSINIEYITTQSNFNEYNDVKVEICTKWTFGSEVGDTVCGTDFKTTGSWPELNYSITYDDCSPMIIWRGTAEELPTCKVTVNVEPETDVAVDGDDQKTWINVTGTYAGDGKPYTYKSNEVTVQPKLY